MNSKVLDFHVAMKKYETHQRYTQLEHVVSMSVILLQLLTFLHLIQTYPHDSSLIYLSLCFITAYLATDFLNGFMHMFMDNNTHYTSFVGPFIAAFHLHHARLTYTHQNAAAVYFYESGSKFWLVFYLLMVFYLQQAVQLQYGLNLILVSVGILSSVAEVSHYWCHNASSPLLLRLQKARILLSKKHHALHHRQDNMNYAFLNGLTDPLLNKISHYCYSGYKNNADQHTKAYLSVKLRAHPPL